MVLRQFMRQPRIHSKFFLQLTLKLNYSYIFHINLLTKFRTHPIHFLNNAIKRCLMLSDQLCQICSYLLFERSYMFENKSNQLNHFQNLKPSHFFTHHHWRFSRFVLCPRTNIKLRFFIFHSLVLFFRKLLMKHLVCLLKESFSWIKFSVVLLKRYSLPDVIELHIGSFEQVIDLCTFIKFIFLNLHLEVILEGDQPAVLIFCQHLSN